MIRVQRFSICFFIVIILLAQNISYGFWYGEHKFVGDQAFNKALTLDMNRANMWQKMLELESFQQKAAIVHSKTNSLQTITYGDLIAVSGEYEKDFRQMFYMLVRQYPQYWTSWDAKYMQEAKSDSSLISKIKNHYKTEKLSINKEDSYNDVNIIFADGSHFLMENTSHFADFGLTHTISDELSSGVQKFIVIPDGRMNSLLEYHLGRQIFYRGVNINSSEWKLNIAQVDSFLVGVQKENIATKYCVLHTLALQFADLAGNEFNKQHSTITNDAKGILMMQIAFMFNAYADHFLQDAFASGHLVVAKKELKSFNGKGAHDYYNKEGIQVDNIDVSPWIAYGDGYLDTNQINYQKMLQASINSLNDVWFRFFQHSKYPASQTMIEELHDKSEKQIIAMFMRQYTAMRVIPLPVELGQVEFTSSRNGIFLGTTISMPKLFQSNLFPDADFYVGFGRNFWFGHDSRMKHKESNLWLACSASYGWFSPTNETAPLGLAKISLLESVWFNSIILDPFSFRFIQMNNASASSKYASNFMAKNHLFSIWNPSFGYEYKSIATKWSWAFRFNYLSLTSNLQKNWYPSFQLRRYL